MTGRRTLVLLVVLAALGIPAGVLQAMCIGRSCANDPGTARVPFCPLPDDLRKAIANGYREGRSPEVLGVHAATPVYTGLDDLRSPWPGPDSDVAVPLVFAGEGVAESTPLSGATLDAIAPTVSSILDFERPFPEVRSGIALDLVVDGERPRLVLLIAWKGIGSKELSDRPEAWPFLASLIDGGAGALDASTGSLPLDPAATLATIGTGGLPSQHGITGSFLRNDAGEVVPAFGEGAPVPVIASLADDLEEADRRTLVGLVATDERDRGLVGGNWYQDQDPIDVSIGDAAAAPLAVEADLATGFGADDAPDVLGVALDGDVGQMDRLTRRIVGESEAATDGSTLVVVAGTGTWERSRLAISDVIAIEAVEDAVPGEDRAVEATVPGGLFLDQGVLRDQQVTGQVAVDGLLQAQTADGSRLMADAFQGFAVSFARYC